MASSDLRDELRCPICLEIFSDPVNLTCGHTYCRACILRMLDTQEGGGAYNCPECRTRLPSRPALQRNIALCNIVQMFRSETPEQSGAGVRCSYCIFSTVPAVQSCLHCEASLCSSHLRVHSRSTEHVLTEATRAPEKRKCSVHKEILKYHCLVDEACVCVTCCLAGEHHGHQVEPLDDASEKKKEIFRTLLRKLSSKRETMVTKIQDLEERGSRDPQDEVMVPCPDMSGEQVLYTVSSLIQLFQITKDKVAKMIRHIEELCSSSDPVSVLQEKDVDIQDLIGEEGDELQGLGQRRRNDGGRTSRSPERLILDVNTAANNIRVSEDMTTMYWSTVYQNRPETPERFQYNQMLSSQAFSSGGHYWEVETSDTGDWRVGVAYGTVLRMGDQSYFGDNDQSWCLRRLYRNQYSVLHDNMVTTYHHTFTCNRFRIFLDYEAGQVSFYELSRPIRHLHTVTTTFTEPLHAAFGIGYWSCGDHCCLKVLHQDHRVL
ncbi:E3 ubiquitin/ISG15 ligase TRIM25-like [Engystomops pustulosus]|uniref:E3 ubiquitin/ISG15 ligase TRIM25-like n=1 Tax=Engystomops pustulosus TaxID=76066 RepID=UPI003AFB6936